MPADPLPLHTPPAKESGAVDSAKIDTLTIQVEALARIMSADVEEKAERADRRSKFVNRVIVPLVGLIIAGGGAGGYRLASEPSAAEGAAEAIGTKMDAQAGADAARTAQTDHRIQKLGERSVAQEVLITESIQYIGEKIDEAHPKQAGAVDKPASLKAAETRVESVKRAKAVDEIFAETDGDS